MPHGAADFIEQQQRAFSTNRFTVATDASAFAGGLEGHGVWPTLKHFPGLGLATVSTDVALVRITAPAATLMKGLLPYTVAFRRNLDPLVMLSTAVYPALDWRAAAWSPPIIHGLLRGKPRLLREPPSPTRSTAPRRCATGPLPAWRCEVRRPAPTCS